MTQRIVVLRTSRFLGVAVDGVRERWPLAKIRVLHQPGGEADLVAAGITPEPALAVSRGWMRFTTVLRCRAGWHLLAWRPDEVVLQWWTADGREHASADCVALLLGRRRFHAVLPDGSWTTISAGAHLRRSLRRGGLRLVGIALIAIIAVTSLLAWPAYLRARRRPRRSHAAAGA